MSSVSNIFQRQTQYALRMYKCSPTEQGGEQVDNLMDFLVDRPFILLHAFTVRRTDQRDRYSDMSQGMSNALLYLDSHPVVQIMNVAEVSSFHIAAGRFYIQDLRPDNGDIGPGGEVLSRGDYEQYVFVLLCLNF
jgi:hypothetical protein